MSAAQVTHAELVSLAEKWLWRQGCGVIFTELNTLATPDAIGFRTTTSILVECEASRADFLAGHGLLANVYLPPERTRSPKAAPPNSRAAPHKPNTA